MKLSKTWNKQEREWERERKREIAYWFFRDYAEFTLRDSPLCEFKSCIPSCHSSSKNHIRKCPSHFFLSLKLTVYLPVYCFVFEGVEFLFLGSACFEDTQTWNICAHTQENKKAIFNPKFLWCWQYLIYHTALLSSVLPDICCIKMLTNQAEDMFWNINGLSGFDLEIPFLWTWGWDRFCFVMVVFLWARLRRVIMWMWDQLKVDLASHVVTRLDVVMG